MSQFYYDIPGLGEPPVCTTLAFRAWVRRFLAHRLGQLTAARAYTTVHHFANNGNDSTGTGTVNAPFRTIAKAQALLTAWGNSANGLILKFKCGDLWNPDTDAKLDFTGRRHVLVTNYGDASLGKPRFWRWSNYVGIWQLGTHTTRGDEFTNVKSWADVGGTPWYTVRQQGRVDECYRQVAGIDEVNTQPGTFFHANGLMHLRPFDRDLSGVTFEFVTEDPTFRVPMFGTQDTASGWGPLFFDGLDVSGINLRTYGVETGLQAANPFKFVGNRDDYVSITNCDSTYSSRHHFVTATPSGASDADSTGTILFLYRNTCGVLSSQSGTSMGVANARKGGSESFVYGLTFTHGDIQRPDVVGPAGVGMISHTDGTTSPLLDLWCEIDAPPSGGQLPLLGGFTDAKPWEDLADCRSFLVDCRHPGRPPDVHDGYLDSGSRWSSTLFPALSPYGLAINCDLGTTLLHSAGLTGDQVTGSGVYGNYVNALITVDLAKARTQSNVISSAIGFAISQVFADFAHVEFLVLANGAQRFAWVGDQATDGNFPGDDYKARRSIFRVANGAVRPTDLSPGTVHYGFNVTECAYGGVSRYYRTDLIAGADYLANDSAPVVLASTAAFRTPTAELLLATPTLFKGYPVEYDFFGRPRAGANAIGPYSQVTVLATGADLSAREFVWSPTRHRSAYNQNCTVRPGFGRVIRFKLYGGPAATVGTYVLRVYKLKALGTLLMTVLASLDAATGDLDVNLTVAQTATLDWDSVYVGQLWRIDGDDNTDDLASVILRPPSS